MSNPPSPSLGPQEPVFTSGGSKKKRGSQSSESGSREKKRGSQSSDASSGGDGNSENDDNYSEHSDERASRLDLIAMELRGKPRTSKLERFNYRLDWLLSKRWIQCVFLGMIGLISVIIGGFMYAGVWQFEGDDCDPREEHSIDIFAEGIWEAWTFMADPGTHAKARNQEQRFVAAFITLVGILFFATIVAVIVDITREKMDLLRQGKSRVIEQGHTLVLGWTDRTILVINELCIAMESEGGGVIVVLAAEDKLHMETELGLQVPVAQRLGTKVIIRTGSPLLIGDLTKVSADSAKAIIMLAGHGDPDKADAETLRTMLSLRSLSYPIQGFAVAEVRDIDNEPLVKLVGGTLVETLVSHDVLGRLMLMSARQPGLAKVYEALLGFEGDEFYMREWPELDGLCFGDLPERFPDAVAIGVRDVDGNVMLKPPAHRVIQPGDRIIVIAEDDDTYKPEPPESVEVGEPPAAIAEKKFKEKILFCGWRRDIRDILQYLDYLVTDGTEVHMMTHCVDVERRNERLMEEGLDVKTLQNVRLVHHGGNTSVRRKLEQLPIHAYQSCMIFADQAFETDAMHADSHSLATLLLFRDIQEQRKLQEADEAADGVSNSQRIRASQKMAALARSLTKMRSEQMQACPIVCEVLDPRTQKTIVGNKHVSLASDFCQTNKLIAQVVAMIAEERSVKLLLDELLGVQGCNINVVPASKYVRVGETASFYALSKRALMYDEVAIGYQLRHSISKTELNPPNKSKIMLWDHFDVAILQGNSAILQDRTTGCNEKESVEQTLGVFGELEARNAVRQEAREPVPTPGDSRYSSPGEGLPQANLYPMVAAPRTFSLDQNDSRPAWGLEIPATGSMSGSDAQLAVREVCATAAHTRAAVEELRGLAAEAQAAALEARAAALVAAAAHKTGSEVTPGTEARGASWGQAAPQRVQPGQPGSMLDVLHGDALKTSCGSALEILEGLRAACSVMGGEERRQFGSALDLLRQVVLAEPGGGERVAAT